MKALAVALILVVAGCGSDTPEASVDRPEPTMASASVGPTHAGQHDLELESVIIPPDEPPPNTTLSGEGRGRGTLGELPLFPSTAAELVTAPGFVDGRWSRFAGSEEDFAESRNFILTWVVQYATTDEAEAVVARLLNELQSEDRYGWGIGKDAGLGDEGTCLDGENPQLGGHPETICVWRRGPLVMVVGGGNRNPTPVPDDAAAMDARAESILP